MRPRDSQEKVPGEQSLPSWTQAPRLPGTRPPSSSSGKACRDPAPCPRGHKAVFSHSPVPRFTCPHGSLQHRIQIPGCPPTPTVLLQPEAWTGVRTEPGSGDAPTGCRCEATFTDTGDLRCLRPLPTTPSHVASPVTEVAPALDGKK